MKQYQFKLTIVVEGVKYTAGELADEDEIPAGCLDSLLRLGRVQEYRPELKAVEAPPQPAPEIKEVKVPQPPPPIPAPTPAPGFYPKKSAAKK